MNLNYFLTTLLCICLNISFFNGVSSEYCDAEETCTTTEKTEISWKKANSVYDFTVKDIHGKEVDLSKYKGKVLIIVNVASQCGFTDTNYKELVELDEKYGNSKEFKILAFPSNDFNGQEPGTPEEILEFAKKYNAKFDIFAKVEVNGDNASPLWKYLKRIQGGLFFDAIKWNFTKFIIDKHGVPVERHGPTANPLSLVSSLEKYW